MRLPRPPARVLAAAGVVLGLASFPTSTVALGLQMGIVDETLSESVDPTLLDRLNVLDASLLRLNVYWNRIAPDTPSRPAGFDARDPASSSYDFSHVDTLVLALAARHVAPILTVFTAPAWAEGNTPADHRNRTGGGGTYNPNPHALGDFAHALAARYSGRFVRAGDQTPLPRVSRFQAWNEPNFGQYLISARQADIPHQYARMLTAFYKGAKSVHRSNVVIAAGLGPFGFNGTATDLDPQVFMRAVLCLRGRPGTTLKRTSKCRDRAYFDAWAQHPYTLEGTPTSKGVSPDAGAMGNMAEMVKTLNRAMALGTVRPRTLKQFWVTEMGWYSDPPGIVAGGAQLGVPLSTQGAYLSEAAYRLWRLGVRVFLWFGLRDYPNWPGGLYSNGTAYLDDRPKPAAAAFRLPLYAETTRGTTLIWAALPPPARRHGVAIEARTRRRWSRATVVRSPSNGIVQVRLPRRTPATYRIHVLDGPQRGLTSASFRAVPGTAGR